MLPAVNRQITKRKVVKPAASKAVANQVAASEENSPSVICGSNFGVGSVNSPQNLHSRLIVSEPS